MNTASAGKDAVDGATGATGSTGATTGTGTGAGAAVVGAAFGFETMTTIKSFSVRL